VHGPDTVSSLCYSCARAWLKSDLQYHTLLWRSLERLFGKYMHIVSPASPPCHNGPSSFLLRSRSKLIAPSTVLLSHFHPSRDVSLCAESSSSASLQTAPRKALYFSLIMLCALQTSFSSLSSVSLSMICVCGLQLAPCTTPRYLLASASPFLPCGNPVHTSQLVSLPAVSIRVAHSRALTRFQDANPLNSQSGTFAFDNFCSLFSHSYLVFLSLSNTSVLSSPLRLCHIETSSSTCLKLDSTRPQW
jgi:hypothetical protein